MDARGYIINFNYSSLTEEVIDYSINCTSDSLLNMLRVTSRGLLESSGSGRCGAWSDWRLSECRCHLRIDYRSISATERSRQSLGLDVVVKPPLYSLARAQPVSVQNQPKGIRGLPFGGPYPILLSFHDDLGEIFDAVAGRLLHLLYFLLDSCS